MSKIREILDNLSTEQYKMMIGEKSCQPLTETFSKKRVVHPGANGQMVPPVKQQEIWLEYMKRKGDKSKKKAVYIHIPFCSQICLYCGFFQNYSNEERETMYVDRLIKQLSMAKEYKYVQDSVINAVFFGGGTPSTLSPYNADRLLKTMNEVLPLANDCEITMEARVHDLVDEKLQVWFKHGVNRISVGVQSFDTAIRQSMGRKDDKETVIENLKRAASYNQAVLIIDLIYGLPAQSVDNFVNDLKIADSLPIDGMDLYQLNVFEQSALKKAIDNGKIPPAATTKQQAKYLEAAILYLDELAYKRLSVCHWAKTNRERSMYNTLAKSGADVIPFGSGAGGFVGDISMFLNRDLQRYMNAIDERKWPLMVLTKEAEGKVLFKDIQAQTENCMVNIQKLAQVYSEELLQLEEVLNIWVEYGLFEKCGHTYKMTIAGQFWQNNITQTIIELTQQLLMGKKSFEVQPIAAQG